MNRKKTPKADTGKSPKDRKTSRTPNPEKNEVVTELMKQVFEIQIEDIEKKLMRLGARQTELRAATLDVEEKIDKFEKETGAIISEKEEEVEKKNIEKIEKREEMFSLSREIKNKTEKHNKYIKTLEEKYEEMVKELTKHIEELEEEIKVLDDFKQNRDAYFEICSKMEKQLDETSMQHHREMFQIEKKSEIAKIRVKKELESRLLQLSIEFQQISQEKIGNPCHRVTKENKALQNEINVMSTEVEDYEEKYNKTMNLLMYYKHQAQNKILEKDKVIAKTIVLSHLIKILFNERIKLLEKLQDFLKVETENRLLQKTLKTNEFEIDRLMLSIEEVQSKLEEKKKDISLTKEANSILRKNIRRLVMMIRNALKMAEEALAVRLIPMSGLEDERFMTNEARMRLFRKRRDSAFQRKGKKLQYLLEFLSKAQLGEEEKKLLKSSTEDNLADWLNFSLIFGKGALIEKDSDTTEPFVPVSEEKVRVFFGSDASLPRSISVEVLSTFDSDLDSDEVEVVSDDKKESEEKGGRKKVTQGKDMKPGSVEEKESRKRKEKKDDGVDEKDIRKRVASTPLRDIKQEKKDEEEKESRRKGFSTPVKEKPEADEKRKPPPTPVKEVRKEH